MYRQKLAGGHDKNLQRHVESLGDSQQRPLDFMRRLAEFVERRAHRDQHLHDLVQLSVGRQRGDDRRVVQAGRLFAGLGHADSVETGITARTHNNSTAQSGNRLRNDNKAARAKQQSLHSSRTLSLRASAGKFAKPDVPEASLPVV